MDPGQATDAAAGIVCPWLSQRRNKAWYRLAKGGARYYTELIAQLKLMAKRSGYQGVRGYQSSYRTENSNKWRKSEKTARDAPEIGEIAILSPSETKQLFPPLSEVYGSVYVSGGARVNGRALRESLIRASIKYSVTFRKGDALTRHGGKQSNWHEH